jgi:hypothetical protein
MTRLLSLDPGGTTGWSLWEYTPTSAAVPIVHGQIRDGVDGFIRWWRDASVPMCWDEVLSESFALDGRTPKPDVTPLRIEGALSVLWPGTLYQPNVLKRHGDDVTLKRLGFWWRGEQHARDTARHVLANMKIRRHAPTIAAYWPRGAELATRELPAPR